MLNAFSRPIGWRLQHEHGTHQVSLPFCKSSILAKVNDEDMMEGATDTARLFQLLFLVS
jgi:hypothetical protein